MGDRYYLIPQISRQTKNWTARITVTEEIPTMICKTKALLKRYVFTDNEVNYTIHNWMTFTFVNCNNQTAYYNAFDDIGKSNNRICVWYEG